MRKLLVVLLATVLALVVWADNVTVSWSGSASFTLTIDEKGIDVGGEADVDLTWAPLSTDVEGEPVSVSLSWGFHDDSAGLSSISFNGKLLQISYVNDAASLDKYFYNVGSDYISVSLVAIPGLTFYYADIIDETNANGTDTTMNNYFDDFVGAEFSQDMDMFSLKVLGAFYDTDAVDTSADYEYAGVVYLTGADTLEGLSVEVAFANTTASDTAYGVIASYSLSTSVEPITITVEPGLHYSENLEAIKFADTAGDAFTPVSDAKKVTAAVSVEAAVDPVTLGVALNPYYDIAENAYGSDLDVTAELAVDPISVDGEFYVDDVLDFANTWEVNANMSAAVDPVTVGGAFKYIAAGDYGYNVTLSFDIEEGLTATAFYGTLYDADGDDTVEIHPQEEAQWYVQVSYSAEF